MPPPLGDPSAFSFFQLILLLDRFFADRPETGSVFNAAGEVARFGALASLGFPAADIAALDWRPVDTQAGEADRLRLHATVTFLGLYGPASPLPPHFTEELLGGHPEQDAIRDFLDLFNHRLISLVFRAWKKYRYYAVFRGRAEDDLSRCLFALIGRQGPEKANLPGGSHLPGAGPGGADLDWPRLLRFTGVLSLNCRSPAVMDQVITTYFGVPARVEEAVERVVTIPQPQQSRLGGRRSLLSTDWIIGDTLQDVAGKFRVWLGPLTWVQFQTFLPGGKSHQPLYALIRYLVRDALDFDVWAIPAEHEMPRLALGMDAAVPLGWATWLGGKEAGAEAGHRGVPLPLPAATR